MPKSKYPIVKAWRAKNKDKVNEQARRYRAKHPETGIKAREKYHALHKEEVRERAKLAARERRKTPKYKEAQRVRNLRYKAKIRVQQQEIAGRPCPEECELCGNSEDRIVYDHCHEKGHFRGWICDRCNRVLGSVKDDTMLLQLMVKYLERNKYGQVINETEKSVTKI